MKRMFICLLIMIIPTFVCYKLNAVTDNPIQTLEFGKGKKK